jgi:hypothetical protein
MWRGITPPPAWLVHAPHLLLAQQPQQQPRGELDQGQPLWQWQQEQPLLHLQRLEQPQLPQPLELVQRQTLQL